MSDFLIGIHRRIFNKNLKEAIVRYGKTAAELHKLTGINPTTLSEIINFKRNPRPDQREKLALTLEIPEDDLFPEKYDDLYNIISPSSRSAEVKVDFLRLNAPEVLALKSPEDPQEDALDKEKNRVVKDALYILSPKERRILEMRNGFDGEILTLDEVAAREGVSRERIRQVEAKALERLRFGSDTLKEYK